MNSVSFVVLLGVAVLATCQYPRNTVNFPFDLPQCRRAGKNVGETAGSEACQALQDQCIDQLPRVMAAFVSATPNRPNIKPCQNNYISSCKGPCSRQWTTCLANNPRVDDADVVRNCGDPREFFDILCDNECSSAFNQAIA